MREIFKKDSRKAKGMFGVKDTDIPF